VFALKLPEDCLSLLLEHVHCIAVQRCLLPQRSFTAEMAESKQSDA